MITPIGEEIKFQYIKRKTKKTQIVLCNTLRPYLPYLNSLLFRHEQFSNVTPHYIIGKRGEIVSLVPPDYYSKLVPNKNAIVIAFENLGWLQKCTLSPMYVNWIGDVYRGEPVVSRWRDRFFWDVYTDAQVESAGWLINDLCTKYDISKTLLPDSGVHPKIQKFEGIVTRANYDDIYTDISPALDLTRIEKFIHDEQQKAPTK